MKSYELFGGLIGPLFLESIVTDKLEFKVFENLLQDSGGYQSVHNWLPIFRPDRTGNEHRAENRP